MPHGRTHHGGPGDRAPGARLRPPWPIAGGAWATTPRYRRLVERHPKVGPQRGAREAPRDARDRQPLHRALPRRGRPRVGDAPQRQPRDRATASAATSSSARRRSMRALGPCTCPTAISRSSTRDRSSSTTTSRPSAGRRTTPRANRAAMLRAVTGAVAEALGRESLGTGEEAINCHHNYVARERHFGEDVLVTRKGAVRASAGELGIIPGLDGDALLHRARQGQPRELPLLLARRGPRDVARRGAPALHARGPRARRPRASSAARTPACSTRRPAPTRTIDAVMAAQARPRRRRAHAARRAHGQGLIPARPRREERLPPAIVRRG